MGYDVHLDHVGSSPLAVVRRRAQLQDLSRVVPEACGYVWKVLKSMQVQGAGRLVALYWDGEINLEVGAEVPTPFPGHGDVVASATPAGSVATAVHFGPYDRLSEPHKAICKWCADHGYPLAGPNWEVYGHWDPDPAKCRTDVFYLLKAAG